MTDDNPEHQGFDAELAKLLQPAAELAEMRSEIEMQTATTFLTLVNNGSIQLQDDHADILISQDGLSLNHPFNVVSDSLQAYAESYEVLIDREVALDTDLDATKEFSMLQKYYQHEMNAHFCRIIMIMYGTGIRLSHTEDIKKSIQADISEQANWLRFKSGLEMSHVRGMVIEGYQERMFEGLDTLMPTVEGFDFDDDDDQKQFKEMVKTRSFDRSQRLLREAVFDELKGVVVSHGLDQYSEHDDFEQFVANVAGTGMYEDGSPQPDWLLEEIRAAAQRIGISWEMVEHLIEILPLHAQKMIQIIDEANRPDPRNN